MKTNLSNRVALAATLPLVAFGLSACGSDVEATTASGFPETLTLGVIPAENSTDLSEGYEPVIKLIEEETGSKVELSAASDYAGVIEGLIADRVDLAFLGSFGYVIATHNDAKITPLGAVTPAKGEAPGYYSLGLTQGDNAGVDSIEDFAGKNVCFVDPGSTSGFLYPSAGLIESGVIASGAESDLSKALKPVYAGAHDASALSIKNGDCEVGFAMQPMVEDTLVKSGDLQDGDLKEVWKSEMIPGSLFVARDSLGSDIVEKLSTLLVEKANAEYLLSKGFCEGECLITDEDAYGVAPATDSDYDGVRAVCATTKSEKCEG